MSQLQLVGMRSAGGRGALEEEEGGSGGAGGALEEEQVGSGGGGGGSGGGRRGSGGGGGLWRRSRWALEEKGGSGGGGGALEEEVDSGGGEGSLLQRTTQTPQAVLPWAVFWPQSGSSGGSPSVPDLQVRGYHSPGKFQTMRWADLLEGWGRGAVGTGDGRTGHERGMGGQLGEGSQSQHAKVISAQDSLQATEGHPRACSCGL